MKAKLGKETGAEPRIGSSSYEDALQYVDQAVADAALSRIRHFMVQQAIQRLGFALHELAELKKVESKKKKE